MLFRSTVLIKDDKKGGSAGMLSGLESLGLDGMISRAAIAHQATTFNYLTHEQKKQKEALIAQALEEGDEMCIRDRA